MSETTLVEERPIQQPSETQPKQTTPDIPAGAERSGFINKIKAVLSRPKPDADKALRDIASGSLPEGKEKKELDLTEKEQEFVDDLGEKLGLLNRTTDKLRVLGSHMKEHPETIGAITAGALGLLGMISQVPIPHELASKMSPIVGLATLGSSKGEGVLEKMKYAAVGAVVGLGVGEVGPHISSTGAVEAAVSVADDIPLVLLGANALRKRQEGKNLAGRMSKEKPVLAKA